MSELDPKGRCCGRKPIRYRGHNPHYFCDRCDRAFDPETAKQMENWAWKPQGFSGDFVRKAGTATRTGVTGAKEDISEVHNDAARHEDDTDNWW